MFKINRRLSNFSGRSLMAFALAALLITGISTTAKAIVYMKELPHPPVMSKGDADGISGYKFFSIDNGMSGDSFSSSDTIEEVKVATQLPAQKDQLRRFVIRWIILYNLIR